MDFCTLGEMLLSSGIDITLIGCKREELLFRLNALESYILAHTHNNFVNKRKSFHAKSENGKLLNAPSFVTGKTTVYIPYERHYFPLIRYFGYGQEEID